MVKKSYSAPVEHKYLPTISEAVDYFDIAETKFQQLEPIYKNMFLGSGFTLRRRD